MGEKEIDSLVLLLGGPAMPALTFSSSSPLVLLDALAFELLGMFRGQMAVFVCPRRHIVDFVPWVEAVLRDLALNVFALRERGGLVREDLQHDPIARLHLDQRDFVHFELLNM